MKYLFLLLVVGWMSGPVATSHAARSCMLWPNELFFRQASAEDVRACLAAGMSLSGRDENGRTSLHWAAAAAVRPSVIVELLSAGANQELTDLAGLRAIHVAAAEGRNPLVLSYLIVWGGDVEAGVSGRSGRCPWPLPMRRCAALPLHLAAARADGADYVAILLAAGANADVRDDESRTPLHHAAAVSLDTRSIQLLLRAGAPVDQADRYGHSPLQMAAKRCEGAKEIVPLLLGAGASPDQGDEDGTTPLMWAARFSCSGDIMRMLVDASKKPCAVDRKGRTVLQQWQQNPNLNQDETYWRLHEQCSK